jgi:hypothetical protein
MEVLYILQTVDPGHDSAVWAMLSSAASGMRKRNQCGTWQRRAWLEH